jgi:uncharacterized protein YeeX (DUF496 family)
VKNKNLQFFRSLTKIRQAERARQLQEEIETQQKNFDLELKNLKAEVNKNRRLHEEAEIELLNYKEYQAKLCDDQISSAMISKQLRDIRERWKNLDRNAQLARAKFLKGK